MRRLWPTLIALLGLTHLAAAPVSVAVAASIENRASGSASDPNNLIGIEPRLDVSDNHIHLEELNPSTGEVLQNIHLRWPEGGGEMNWRMDGCCRIESIEVDGQVIWRVVLLPPFVRELAIGLCLLWHQLISHIDLVDPSGRTLKVTSTEKSANRRARVTWLAKSAAIDVSGTELEAIMFFCLRAVRDGVAEVDHIDIDVEPRLPNERSGSFVLKFPDSIAPVSPEEANRRLGI